MIFRLVPLLKHPVKFAGGLRYQFNSLLAFFQLKVASYFNRGKTYY